MTDPHRRFFAGWSRFYERTPLFARLLREQQDEALRRLAPLRGERVLDLGCGTGRALQLVPGAVGADASLEMLRQGPWFPSVARQLRGTSCSESFTSCPIRKR